MTHNCRSGALYAIVTALLLSTQEPLSFLAARRLDWEGFVLVTQVSLLLSIPLLNWRPQSRRDFVAILSDPGMYGKLGVIFALGMTGLLLYKFGLDGAHPIIIAAVLNLSPFWAAVVARAISGVSIPVAAPTFFGCLAAAFFGALAVAWSQLPAAPQGVVASLLKGSWAFALPIPLLSALNGTLIAKWFAKYEESAAIGVNFLVPAAVLIPFTAIKLSQSGTLSFADAPAILLMMLGTLLASAIGRVVYQVALTATGGDNGYVTMFFLAVPALTALVSFALSFAIPDLNFRLGPLYFVGLALIAAALLTFSYRSWRDERAALAP